MYILLEERKKIAQTQARLQQCEAMVKIKESKARISNFIRIGEILERCRMSLLDHKVLAGGFLSMRESLRDPKLASEWAAKGEPFATRPSVPKKEPPALQVIFKTQPPAEVRKLLWSRGFTCEGTDLIWEGKGLKKEVESVVIPHGRVYKMTNPKGR
ncbi:MAG: hypothetical protein WCG05_05530 [Alphaproteobacteria bacterium]